MSGENNRPRPRTGGSLVLTAALAAAGAIAGAAAVDHIQAQQENRPSAVDNLVRWFRQDVMGVDDGPSRRQRRLSRIDIAALPTRTYGERPAGAAAAAGTAAGSAAGAADARDEKCFCAICQETFLPRDQLMRLPCFHEYHTDCIVDALTAAECPRCPVCRHPVTLS